MRRSSTNRSMGQRSDFDASFNGEEDVKSVDTDNEERVKERQEADAHTAHYVSEQLSRVRSNQSIDFDKGDEFEAQLDEQ